MLWWCIVASAGKKEDLGPSVVGKSSRRKKAVAAGAVVGGVTLLGSIYLGKLAYDVKRDVNNLFEWLDGVIGKKAIVKGLSDVSGDFFVFENVVGAIRKLLPVSRRPVFDFLIRFVNEEEFVNKAESRYCNKSSEVSGYDDDLSDMIINNPLHSSGNNKFATSFF